MKRIFYIPVIIVLSLFTFCEEEGPFIILSPSELPLIDTSYISSTVVLPAVANVLIEEFSGVRCSNCPKGNEKLEELINSYGEQIVAISAHSDFLAAPYGDDQDLRTQDANDLGTLIGGISSKPAASLNRRLQDGQTAIAIKNPDSWEQYVITELAGTRSVNMEIEILNADVMERTIEFKITLSYSADASSHSLGFGILENDIIADQQDGIVKVEDYVHKHVLRKFISPLIGETLTTELTPNTIIEKSFRIDVDDYDEANIWNINNLSIVAFIRTMDNSILQSTYSDVF